MNDQEENDNSHAAPPESESTVWDLREEGLPFFLGDLNGLATVSLLGYGSEGYFIESD